MFKKVTKDDLGVRASKINFLELKDVSLPQQVRDEIPTLNKMGYMKKDLSEFCEAFIKYAAEINNGVVLEIGCAYGFVAQKILEQGNRLVANDISSEHLTALIKNTPQDKLDNLYVVEGSFPGEVEFEPESFNAILASRVIHFLKGEEVAQGLKSIYKWLKPKGKFFFTAVSPYNYTLKDNFLATYQQRLSRGEKWPGVVMDFNSRATDHAEYLQDFIHVFDVQQLEELLPEHGFKIEQIKLFDYPNNVDSDGKGHIGFVATKV
jgi:SAM-dependent methyltransferase